MKKNYFVFVALLIVTMSSFAANPEHDFNYKLFSDGESIVITGFKNNLAVYDIPSEIEGIPVSVVDIEFLGFSDVPEILVKLPNGLKHFSLTQIYFRGTPLSHITVESLPTTLEKCIILAQGNRRNPESFYISLKGSIQQLNSLTEIRIEYVDFEEKSIIVRKEWQKVQYHPIEAMYSFSNTNIEEVIFEDGLQIVDCFERCLKLKKVTLPASVTKIGSDAFIFCSQLSEIFIPESIEKIDFSYGRQNFDGTSIPLRMQVKLRKLGYQGSFGNQ